MRCAWCALLGLLLMVSCSQPTPSPIKPPAVVGNDADEHGCKAAAGYQWSALRGTCIRLFEEGIRLDPKAPQLDQTTSAFVVFKADNDDAQAELFLPNAQGGGLLLPRTPDDNGAGTWRQGSYTLTQWKGMYTLQNSQGETLYEGPASR